MTSSLRLTFKIALRPILLCGLLLSFPFGAGAIETVGIEIMHKSDVDNPSDAPMSGQLIKQYSKLLGQRLAWLGRTPTKSHRVLLPAGTTPKEALAAAARLRKADGVLWSGAFSSARLKPMVKGQKTLINRIVIKLKNTSSGSCADANLVKKFSDTAGVGLKPLQALASGACVYRLSKALPLNAAQTVQGQLKSLPEVQYVDLDSGVRNLEVIDPKDPFFPALWFLEDTNLFSGSSDVQSAWNITTGRPDVSVAVIDSGILFHPTHPDLASSLSYLTPNHSQIAGWDMISSPVQARDGNPRDRNPKDEGNWVTRAQTRVNAECESSPVQTSTWHGSHVAGTIAAATNNRIGISGINWQVRLLPVRVVGACEGSLYDLTDGIYWAVSNIDVPGTEPNPYPAHVVNISLGGEGTCPDSLQEAINFALARNVTVVIAAGNETTDVVERGMANCKGALIVAASGAEGDLTYYSNYGLDITLAAPGGDPSYGTLFEVLSTTNGSTTRPSTSKMKYGYASGTSMAAPVVSGVVALMISAAMDRGITLSAEAIRTILTETARPYPPGSRCGTGGELEGLCGAGVIDASRAVAQAASYTQNAP